MVSQSDNILINNSKNRIFKMRQLAKVEDGIVTQVIVVKL